jgi:hypothetical protein
MTDAKREELETLAGVRGYYPTVNTAFVAEDGNVWLALNTHVKLGGQRWLVLDKHLTPIRTVESPTGMRNIAFIRNELWGTVDYNGIPAVARFSLAK